jgi:DNA-3-methyladenine glycosylase II
MRVEYLEPAAPFDFSAMLRRPVFRPFGQVVVDLQLPAYTRVFRAAKSDIPVTITSLGTVDHPRLALAYPAQVSENVRIQIREQVARTFSTDVRLEAFYEQMSTTPAWLRLIQALRGLRSIQDADLFESLTKVIIGQQLNVSFAATLVGRLVALGGRRVDWNGLSLPVFPSPDQVAAWSYRDLRAQSFSQRKAEYVIDRARLVVQGKLDLDALWESTDAEIYEILMPLRGIGRWTVDCFLLFGLARPDVIPGQDIGVQQAI